MRFTYVALILGGLSACAPAVPDSAAGVGFNSPEAQRAREAQLAGAAASVAAPAAVSSQPLAAAGTMPAQQLAQQPAQQPVGTTAMGAYTPGSTDSAEDIARETAAALAAANANSGVMPVQASPENPAPQALSNPGISDENDFQAVSSRESIQSDAERIARNKALYQEVEPTAVPQRTGDTGPNIVRYALSTRNQKGQPIYNRGGLKLAGRTERNCAKYGSADLAQMAFLEKGGPERDRMGLDPDGDGFACGWDPAPFRQAAQAAGN
ncbi:hypothetical protein [Pseudodonghicola flavimaris]|uniref:Excalibur calcium-binding domain-containing protein n=1 Tax=Pseudodonghicola flavimaris TaxID=3050036 RepID=A0ABT7F0M4_9RHOB|nr:hypothetical protein [Pseudodonghicola flavimaris]MDK3018143.1 hypothetical protein [Pseudodonghicola flavimaris]